MIEVAVSQLVSMGMCGLGMVLVEYGSHDNKLREGFCFLKAVCKFKSF